MKFKDSNGEEWEDSATAGYVFSGDGKPQPDCRFIRKLPKPEPMPEILPGDYISRESGDGRAVHRVGSPPAGYHENRAAMYYDPREYPAWDFAGPPTRIVEIHRNGKLIWKAK